MLHKRHKYDIIIILAVVNLAISLFLAVSEAKGITVPCDLTGGCETVLSSKYSHIAGVPLTYLGVAFSGALIVAALMANHYRLAKRLLTLLLAVGALFALGFLGIQFFVLRALCQYCLTVDILTIVMLLWDMNIEHLPHKFAE